MIAVVVLLHAGVTYEVAQEMQDAGPAPLSIKRMEATYVSEIKMTAPPVAAAVVRPLATPAPQPIAKPKKAPKPPKAASAPQDKPSEPEAAKQLTQAASEPASSVA